MRSFIFGALAAAAVAVTTTTPAAAQWRHHHHGHWGGPGISFSFGAPSYGYYGGPYAYYGGPYSAYADYDDCRIVRVRHVRPDGRVVIRNVQRCY